jgi:hypothetical protein
MAGLLNGWAAEWLGEWMAGLLQYMAGCQTTGRLGAAARRLDV